MATVTSATSVSRMISNAGIRKAASAKTIVRGYHHFTEGYKVTQGQTNVFVSYESSSSMRNDWDAYALNRESALNRIAELLTAKGYEVTKSERGNLIVKKIAA